MPIPSFENNWYDIATSAAGYAGNNAGAQRAMITSLLEKSPILASIPMEQATHADYNVYDRLMAADVIGLIDRDAPLPVVDSQLQLEMSFLSMLGARIMAPEDKSKQMGGPERLIAQKLPPIFQATGMSAERSIYYNSLIASAYKFGNIISASDSPTGNELASIVAVTWTPGQTTGLVSKLPYDIANSETAGMTFQTTWYNGGNMFLDPTDGINTYGVSIKGMIGMQIANENTVSAIVNIPKTIDTTKFTAQLMDMLERCRADSSTRIYMSRALYSAIRPAFSPLVLHDSLIRVEADSVMTIDGFPVITSYNIKRDEEPFILN